MWYSNALSHSCLKYSIDPQINRCFLILLFFDKVLPKDWKFFKIFCKNAIIEKIHKILGNFSLWFFWMFFKPTTAVRGSDLWSPQAPTPLSPPLGNLIPPENIPVGTNLDNPKEIMAIIHRTVFRKHLLNLQLSWKATCFLCKKGSLLIFDSFLAIWQINFPLQYLSFWTTNYFDANFGVFLVINTCSNK